MAQDSEYAFEPLSEGTGFSLYRGTEHGNPMRILAVAVAAERPSPQSLSRLEHEYSLRHDLHAAWAAQPLALTRYQGRAVLLLKDPGGELLDKLIEQRVGQPTDLTRFLRIGIGLTAALRQAHRQGLIHKDVKPANALVDDSGDVWLIGFGIASRLQSERQAPTAPETIAGTLAYMAPEQTGRMNRSVDSRSDLYSLGVTLYQMLTGVLPFVANAPLEWVHCHIARQPVAPAIRCAVPEQLSAIIMRLLAKNPEERYQTSAGLEADLRRCLSQWQSQGRIDPFTLGADDSSDRLLIPEKLYGRECEVAALIATLDRVVAHGSAELVLVSGYSGVGKSSIVNELHKVLVPARGLFAAGKFDQYKRDVPYATLAQAFQGLVRQILVKSEAEVDHWRDAFLEALGPNGQLIVNLVPELGFIIGIQPAVADLPPQEARSRFQLVLRRFLCAFATVEHPLALFLDDLQWLDTATLELLERLIFDPDVRHVLLIGAYRDNEVDVAHPLTRTLAAIRDTGAKRLEIVLAPLRFDDLERLVAEALRCGPTTAGPLAQLVHEKTGGNPFFAIQLLISLAEERMLWFDQGGAGWTWDLGRIGAKGYSNNVVDLMLEKLRRLSQPTQTAIQQFACLGNVAATATLGMVSGQSAEDIHTARLEAVGAGLILRLGESYAFLHDRIREAAYALIPESARAEAHLKIGRMLLAGLPAGDLAEHLFDVANQLNRGAALLVDHAEKVQAAAIDLRVGRKARASAAYSSARAYFAAGKALLDENDWSDHYELTFDLWLELAECELLTGNFDGTAQLIEQLMSRSASRVDNAAVYRLQIQLHNLRSESEQAVDTALTCLRGFGVDLPKHPTEEEVEAESSTLWQILGARPIESLIDLPLMTDPDLQAAMRVLAVLLVPAYFTDHRLWCLQICRMVKLSLQHGTSDAAAHAYSFWGIVLGPLFHRYGDGYRFAKLACDLVEKHEFVASSGKVYASAGLVSAWTQPIATAIDFNQKAIRAATEVGDLTYACYGLYRFISDLLLRNDVLDSVWRESETALAFARQAKYRDVEDIIRSQQRFIATMQGRTATFSTFSDTDFDEATFEAQLTVDRMQMMICWYWILKLKARFLSGDYPKALDAADKAKQLLATSAGQTQLVDYFCYTALTVAALYETASADEVAVWRNLLMQHREQLQEWAESCPPTFGATHALVLGEIARVEKRVAEALGLYEQAIQLAREHGFVQNEGLAHELAAQCYLSYGLETAGYSHLRSARNCYDRWGAHGKVKQLDRRYPRLNAERDSISSATVGPPLGQLDIETVVKASQALSSEVVLAKLIERLMRIAVEHAGAERGLLILMRGDVPQIEAEATTGHGGVAVAVRQSVITPSDLAQSALNYVIRTLDGVLLNNASADSVYSRDEYVRLRCSKSILCLPILKQTRLAGVLYLENELTPDAFTPDRVAVLELLASQAAISLENADLYTNLQLQVGLLQHLPVSAWTLRPDGTPDFVNQVWLDFAGQTYDFVRSHPEAWMTAVHPEDREIAAKTFWEGIHSGQGFAIDYRSLRSQDATYRWLLSQAVPLRDAEGKIRKFAGTTTDIDDQKRAEDALRQAQGDLARINRVTTMGELAASLAHELRQPNSGVMTNADASLLWLGRAPPDLERGDAAITRILRDARRATDILDRIRVQFEKGSRDREVLDLNEIMRETIALLRGEAVRYEISVQTDLANDLPLTLADRVQLQQVVMNLIVNGIEALKDAKGVREMVITARRAEEECILVSISDTGIGFPPQLAEQIFEPFFTTKTNGTGMGLRISRSIIESHNGRLWAVGTPGRGATFHFSLPAADAPWQSPPGRGSPAAPR